MNLHSGGKPPDLGPTGAITGLKYNLQNDQKNNVSEMQDLSGSQFNQNAGNASNENTNKKIKFYYGKNNLGPFHVYIESTSKEFKGKLNAIKVNDIIYSVHPELDNKIKEIDSIGRNRVRINFKDSVSANNLTDSTFLTKYNLEAYIPKFTVLRQGVAYGLPNDIEDEIIKERIKPFDLHCNFTVYSVKRMTKVTIDRQTKEKKVIKTNMAIITFQSQSLPKYIAIGHVRCPVRPYIQKVLLCYNCFRYGHTSKQCRSHLRCPVCAEQHIENDCPKQNLNLDKIECLNCKGNHKTNNFKKFPEYNRQKNIKRTMAEQNVSYKDAEKHFPQKSYASVVGNTTPLDESDVDLGDLDNFFRGSQSNHKNTLSQTPSLRFTQVKIPTKRNRVSSPTLDTYHKHKEILSQHTFLHESNNITNDPIYKKGIEKNTTVNAGINVTEFNISNLIEVVFQIVNFMKQKNSFEINKSEIEGIINNRVSLNSNK